MATLPTTNPNTAMQTQGLTTTAPPIAGTPFSPAQQIAAQAQNIAAQNTQSPGTIAPTMGAPTLSPTTGVQTGIGVTANVNNNVNQAFGATNTNPSTDMSLADKYTLAHQTAVASGQEAPSSQGQGMAGVQSNLPVTSQDQQNQQEQQNQTQAITSTLQNDPGYQQLIQGQQQYMSSVNQGQSLEQQYTDLTNSAGIPALNSQLINMQAVINGTDQDIRNEVTAAGGFATESQVQALASARNKVLTQNYNQLLQTKTDLENTINTQMGLAKDDQVQAQQIAQEQLNFNQQLATYTQKFTQNAQDALTSMQKTEGWDGLYKAALASGDPSAIQRINQTMGQGFDLATMANQDAQAKQLAQQQQQIQQAQAQATLANTKATTQNTLATTAKTQAEIAALPPPVTATTNMPYNGNYTSASDYVNKVLSKQGISYSTVESNTPKGSISVIDNATGQTGVIDPATYKKDPGSYTIMYNNS